jgi:hypothetical protein
MPIPKKSSALFPRLRLMPERPPRPRPVLRIPTFAVKNYNLPPDPLAGFGVKLFGERLDAGRFPDAMRTMARDNRAQYQQSFGEAIKPLADVALDLHRKQFGLNPTKWLDGSDAQRAVYTVDLAPSEGGHAVGVVTLEGLANPRAAVGDPNLTRTIAGGFPGQFAALPDDLYLRTLLAGRGPDGTLDDVLGESWDRITSYNAKAYADGAPMSGMHAIGWNSFVGAETHYTAKIAADGLYQSALMVTGGVHSQRGIVPWTTFYHPDFPGGVVCISLHFGHNLVPGGNMVNSAIAGPLFKSLFRGGINLYGMHDALVKRFGADTANRLLLDPKVNAHFREVWTTRDLGFLADRALLSSLDRFPGGLAKTIGLFVPTTVSTIETARYNQIADVEQYNRLVREGVAKTEADKYDGPGGLEAESRGQIVPQMSPSTTGLAVQTAGSDPFDPKAPVGPPFEGEAATLQRLAADVDSHLLERTAAQEIADRTHAALEAEGSLAGQDAGALAERIGDAELRRGLQEKIATTYLASLSQSPDLAPLLERLGAQGALALTSLTLAAPLMERMTTTVAGTSYLVGAVQSVVLDAKRHELDESAGEIQRRLTDASSATGETSGELTGRHGELAAAQRAVDANPADQSAVQRRDELRKQVDDLARKLEQDQEHEQEVEHDREANAAEAKATEEQTREAEAYAEAHRAEVFGGERHVASR